MPETDSHLTHPARTLIGVCTYQESANIESLITGLREAFPRAELLVVDDNSPDGTAAKVQSLQSSDPQLELVVRKNERGLGSAIVHAMKIAQKRNCDLFLNLDADLSHDPAELPKLQRYAVEHADTDVVIGSRYVAGGKIVGWPIHRRIMSKLLNGFATRFLRLPVKDCSGSMRCYRVSALQSIGLDSLQCTGYAVLEEVLVRLHRQGSRMAELPITFTERELGKSKLTIRESLRSIRFMFKLAASVRRMEKAGTGAG